MKLIAPALCVVSCVGTAAHGLELPAVFGDHMVLQRGMPVPVWGRSEPGEVVTVSHRGQTVAAVADDRGAWRVDLPAMSADARGAALRVRGAADGVEVTFRDVVVGEVWHASGQSNMEWPVDRSDGHETASASADLPGVRFFRHPKRASPEPRFSAGGRWVVSTPDTAGSFSAVGFYFARRVHRALGVPVGVIDTSWSAAAAEAFTPRQSLASDPLTRTYLERFVPDPEQPQLTPAGLWNGLIHPIAPYAHRGVVWYQGEANVDRATAYRSLLPQMIADWRSLWDQAGGGRDFPFLIVQLASFRTPSADPPARDPWAELRDAQAHAAAVTPRAWLTPAVDVGDADDIHPRNKLAVGRRLARLALHHVYGNASVVPVGPTLLALDQDAESGAVSVRYRHAGGITTADGRPPRGFTLRPRGGDGPWVRAEAALVGPGVRLTDPAGRRGPFEVRYAYDRNPMDGPHAINLINAAGLPAVPFRTDAASAP
ncbi:MAG: sialate O-acetylesterase [Planctomycetota bacterium]